MVCPLICAARRTPARMFALLPESGRRQCPPHPTVAHQGYAMLAARYMFFCRYVAHASRQSSARAMPARERDESLRHAVRLTSVLPPETQHRCGRKR